MKVPHNGPYLHTVPCWTLQALASVYQALLPYHLPIRLPKYCQLNLKYLRPALMAVGDTSLQAGLLACYQGQISMSAVICLTTYIKLGILVSETKLETIRSRGTVETKDERASHVKQTHSVLAFGCWHQATIRSPPEEGDGRL